MSATDVGAVKAPTIQRSNPCRRSRQSVSTSPSRSLRNLLGHWAARRIPNEDAIVLLSKDENDAMQVGGAYLANGHVKSAILDLADIRGLIDTQLMPIELWLAEKISEWRKRYIGD
jgi:hypothetical protein